MNVVYRSVASEGRVEPATGRSARAEETVVLFLLMGLAVLSILMLGWQMWSPRPLEVLGITINRLSATLTTLVAGIGVITYRFSVRYLQGHRRRRRFLRLLSPTVVAAFVLMCATNLILLFAAWFLTSLLLHALLTFCRDRPEALRPARKKFLISRLGDLAFIAAIVLIWHGWGTLDLNEFLRDLTQPGEGATVGSIAFLIAAAALTKSAQFPFHTWLPETMEAPTPVSALMHAGIINAGGAILLRFAPLIVRVPEVLLFLSVVGTMTLTIGLLAQWAQVKVKRTLAWSTVGQMGFMMVQLGLGAFPIAAVHIVGHGCYKAWSFLRSGELPAPPKTPASPRRAIGLVAAGVGFSVPALAFASRLTGFDPLHSPGELALTAILALSIGQLWVAILGVPTNDRRRRASLVAVAIISTFGASMAAFVVYRGASTALAPVLGELPMPTGPLAWGAAAVPVLALTALTVLHAALPLLGRTPSGRVLHMHCLHGFHFGAMADRLVDAVWSRTLSMTTGAHRA